MASNKTQFTGEDVLSFIERFTDNEQKRQDSLALIQLMEEASGHPARMWGPSIIGFGTYHYRYDSGHEGDAPLLGFSPRKAAISLYVFTGLEEHAHLLDGLGKYTMGKSCIYIKRLSDIDLNRLKKVMQTSLDYLKKTYGAG
jgi:hypothetical protein